MSMKEREMTALSTKEQSILLVEMPFFFFSYRLQKSLKIVWKNYFRCLELYCDTARRCSIVIVLPCRKIRPSKRVMNFANEGLPCM